MSFTVSAVSDSPPAAAAAESGGATMGVVGETTASRPRRPKSSRSKRSIAQLRSRFAAWISTAVMPARRGACARGGRPGGRRRATPAHGERDARRVLEGRVAVGRELRVVHEGHLGGERHRVRERPARGVGPAGRERRATPASAQRHQVRDRDVDELVVLRERRQGGLDGVPDVGLAVVDRAPEHAQAHAPRRVRAGRGRRPVERRRRVRALAVGRRRGDESVREPTTCVGNDFSSFSRSKSLEIVTDAGR